MQGSLAQEVDDAVLWAGIQSGDEQALGSLMKRYYRSLVHYGTRFTPNLTGAEDCLQDLFLELWQRRNRLPVPVSVRHYLFKAYRNRLLKSRVRHPEASLGELLVEPPDETLTVEEKLVDQETKSATGRRLRNALDNLSVRQREVVYLRYYSNLSNEEIADLMAINRQSVANLLQQALRKLRLFWMLTWWLWLS